MTDSFRTRRFRDRYHSVWVADAPSPSTTIDIDQKQVVCGVPSLSPCRCISFDTQQVCLWHKADVSREMSDYLFSGGEADIAQASENVRLLLGVLT